MKTVILSILILVMMSCNPYKRQIDPEELAKEASTSKLISSLKESVTFHNYDWNQEDLVLFNNEKSIGIAILDSIRCEIFSYDSDGDRISYRVTEGELETIRSIFRIHQDIQQHIRINRIIDIVEK